MFSFSYSITRDYPYRWFTPTAIIGGIILTVLFSAINFFFNAYNMVITTTNDPTAVEADRWTERVPGIFTSRIQPKCQDAIIPVGSNIYTNQGALSYQLISQEGNPALDYRNEPFGSRDRGTGRIIIDFRTKNGRSAAASNRTGWDVTVNVIFRCSIVITIGSDKVPWKSMVLAAQYAPISETYEAIFPGYIHEDAPIGLVWAQRLLLGFWTETVTAITS